MKYPDNIFGQLLRKELEGNDKLERSKRETMGGVRRRKSYADEFSKQYENEPYDCDFEKKAKKPDLTYEKFQDLKKLANREPSEQEQREQEAFNFCPYGYMSGVVEEARRKEHAKKISKQLGWDIDD